MSLRAATIPLAVAAGVLGLAAPASAQPAHHSHASIEHFTEVNTSTTGAPGPILARGAITAAGHDKSVSDSQSSFVFPRGTLTVDHAAVTSTDRFDARTCVGRHSETGTYSIVGGTRAYATVTGYGRYTVSVTTHGCDPSAPPTSLVFVLQASGPLWLS
ncbi:MAG: hypothetical protein ACRDXE_06730 [Acidimicrobiales bacterium]